MKKATKYYLIFLLLSFNLNIVRAANVLIYGPMLATAPNEQSLAVAAGHTVTVVTAAQWNAMSTAQFASYDAIVIPDNGCSTFGGNGDPNLLNLNATKAVWSPAVTGKIYLLGADAVLHKQGQYQLLLTNAINFAAADGRPLTHAAKLLMGSQALVSVFTLALLVARSVNILGT